MTTQDQRNAYIMLRFALDTLGDRCDVFIQCAPDLGYLMLKRGDRIADLSSRGCDGPVVHLRTFEPMPDAPVAGAVLAERKPFSAREDAVRAAVEWVTKP